MASSKRRKYTKADTRNTGSNARGDKNLEQSAEQRVEQSVLGENFEVVKEKMACIRCCRIMQCV